MSVTITFGLATYDDFDGAYFTIENIICRTTPAEVTEIVLIDNHPQAPEARDLANYCRSLRGNREVKYVPLAEPVGTSPARDAIFRHATGDYVLVVDSHVILLPGALAALRRFLEEHHPCDDLIQGVLYSDDLRHRWTHFQDVWRAEMWGIWGSDPRGQSSTNPPFEIFAQGLGLFCARRESWLGFHPLARGFGGEECYIHEKYRRAGRKCWCLPGLGWVHRFGRPKGVPYPLTQWNKVRNYVLEHRELGLPLDRIYKHFVLGEGEDPGDGSPPQGALNRMSQEDWDYLVADPENHLQPPARKTSGCGGCGKPLRASLAELEAGLDREHELRAHVPLLRELAEKGTVIEITHRPEISTVIFAAKAKELVSIYEGVRPPELDGLPDGLVWQAVPGLTAAQPRACDLLFVDHPVHDAPTTWNILETFGPLASRIALHDTEIFGERFDNRPGILPALRRFLKEHPEFVVLKHVREDYGLTVISQVPEDKKPLPNLARQAFNFARAVVQHLKEGGKMVSEATLEKRLDICALCEHRSDNRCSICGCYLIGSPTGQGGKAEWAEQACPLGKWLPEES
ncbi:MAG TPA: glycosyltransferase [Candidatus Hydrogenedentes bacterium]|nr:glycosyltransferase [Candidatus Hydrogenedentota bacterium]